MRLHQLRMTAFGPFAGTEEVGFDELTPAGLYLIHGATGAGKTSILDAICFALYAAVPGSRAGARGTLRSDHAAPDVVPQVQLEFTAAGRRLRITRSPSFSRPKRRGDGETTVQAKVLLQELTGGEWVDRGSRLDEVAQVVDEVVGLGLEQFAKVVMLPQGEFAAFLRATPEDRRGLLERLFDTSRFTDIEDWLAARRRELASQVTTARAELTAGTRRVDDLIGDLEPLAVPPATEGSDDPGSTGDPDDAQGATVEAVLAPRWSDLGPAATGRALDRTVARVSELAGEALARAEDAAGGTEQAAARLAEGRRLDGLLRRAHAARRSLAALGEARKGRDRAETALRLARRSREVAGHLTRVDRAADAATEARDRVSAARELAGAVCPTLSATDDGTGLPTVTLLAEDVDDHTADLTRAEAALDRARSSAARSSALATRVQEQEDEVSRLEQKVAQQEARRSELRQLVSEATPVAERLPAHRTRHEALTRALTQWDARAAAEDEITRCSEARDAARQRAVADEQEVQRLRTQRLEGMAGELASTLGEGEPCPVCGAVEHPRPAAGEDPVTSERIEQAELAATTSRRTLEAAQEELAAAAARRDTHDEQLRTHLAEVGLDDPARTELHRLLDAARQAVDEATEASRTRDRGREQQENLEAELSSVRSRLEVVRREHATAAATARSAVADAAAARAELVSLLDRHRASCPCADPSVRSTSDVATGAGGAPADDPADDCADDSEPAVESDLAGMQAVLTDTVHRHRGAAAGLDQLADALRARDRAARELELAQAELTSALATHGFDDAGAARAALCSDDQVAALEHQVREFDRRHDAAESVLGEPDVVQALELEPPDLPLLTELDRAARESHLAAARTSDHYERVSATLRRVAREVHDALTHLTTGEAEHATVQGLADCVAGTSPDNVLKMRLSAFVLAARLEEVARHASERLSVMTDGRFTLHHSDARAARGARSGLGLRVSDAWTGIERETNTLSGGEAFLASLALALGLGDAVRAEAGGLELQTLFVDEGFGSLDDESLEHVMAVLDGLREGGRCVGIVSHVPELRQRIRAQVRVTKTPSGSHLLTGTGAEGQLPERSSEPAA